MANQRKAGKKKVGFYIPDPIERGEASAERAFDEMLQSDGRMKCPCGNLFDPDNEGGTISPDPYAMPFCDDCCAKAFAPRQPSEFTRADLECKTEPVNP